jgi:hypothetical protein
MSKPIGLGLKAVAVMFAATDVRAQQAVPQRAADIDVYCEGEQSVRLRAWAEESICAYFDSNVPHSCRISETVVFIPGVDFSISRVTGVMTDPRGRRWTCKPFTPGTKKF